MRTLNFHAFDTLAIGIGGSFIFSLVLWHCLSGTSWDSASEGARRIIFPSPGWSWHNRMICFTISQPERWQATNYANLTLPEGYHLVYQRLPLHLAVFSRRTSREINSCSPKRLSPYRECLHGHSIKFKTNVLFHVLFIIIVQNCTDSWARSSLQYHFASWKLFRRRIPEIIFLYGYRETN